MCVIVLKIWKKKFELLVLVSTYMICISISYENLIDYFYLDYILHISMMYVCIFDWLWTPFYQRGKFDVWPSTPGIIGVFGPSHGV